MPLITGNPIRTLEAAEAVLRDFQTSEAPPGLLTVAREVVAELRQSEIGNSKKKAT